MDTPTPHPRRLTLAELARQHAATVRTGLAGLAGFNSSI